MVNSGFTVITRQTSVDFFKSLATRCWRQSYVDLLNEMEIREQLMVAKTRTKRKGWRPPKAAASNINEMLATEDLLAMYKDIYDPAF